ncbi:MAG: helix-turn-helix domain-containing protein [Alphaproteobacteria bacterium]
MLNVTVFFPEQGYASTAVAPIEVFHSVGRVTNLLRGAAPAPRFDVTPVSLTGRQVRASYGLGVATEHSIHDIRDTDIIFVATAPLETDAAIAANRAALPWLRRWRDRGAAIAAVCTGVALLAEAGLLDGKKATTHWALADAYARRYPKADWRPDVFVTEDDGIFCGGGVYSSIDLSLYLVEKFCGHDAARDCARTLLIDMPRTWQSGYAVLPLSRPHADSEIRKAESWLQGHYREAIRLEDVAARFGMSARTFERRFKAATGEKPLAYAQRLRVAMAKQMLETGARSVQEVSSAVGYGDLAFFRTVFKRHTGVAPADYRARFGASSPEPAPRRRRTVPRRRRAKPAPSGTNRRAGAR